jgi:hypothetical protein
MDAFDVIEILKGALEKIAVFEKTELDPKDDTPYMQGVVDGDNRTLNSLQAIARKALHDIEELPHE